MSDAGQTSQAASAEKRAGAGWTARIRTLRLATGLVLVAFIVTHFANHMLALVSLEAAEAGRMWFMALWRRPFFTFLLYGSFLVHFLLALHALYSRRTLRMPVREAAQLVLGLLIPVLVTEHIAATHVLYVLTGIDDTYAYVVNSLWIANPVTGIRQSVAVVVVWLHACLGLYFWLRFRPWFRRLAPVLLILAALVPVLTLLGFVNAGRTLDQAAVARASQGIDQATVDRGAERRRQLVASVYTFYALTLAGVMVLRILRARRERRAEIVVRYPDGRDVRVPRGYSVLEASRLGGIPHHAVCGGRGRCSTCRIRVLAGPPAIPPPDGAERLTLRRIQADPDIRLACQLRPAGDVRVEPILSVNASAEGELGRATPGHEQEIAVLFCDIRGFTALSDSKLPFDTVFLLNRYFASVGRAVERSGGQLDKFIGDGAMAIFGLGETTRDACRQALDAAMEIVSDLRAVSSELSAELPDPLRVAIGIHFGPAIVGTMGYGRVRSVTAIGDTVNIASRLEAVAKELDAAIVVSTQTAELSGLDLGHYERRTVAIRGRMEPLEVVIIPQAATLAERLVPLEASS